MFLEVTFRGVKQVRFARRLDYSLQLRDFTLTDTRNEAVSQEMLL